MKIEDGIPTRTFAYAPTAIFRCMGVAQSLYFKVTT